MKNTNLVKITLLLASMMTILANAIIAPALPEISNAFLGVPNAETWTKLLMTLPALTIAIFASTIGKLMDRIGKLKILFASLLIFALAGTSGLWLETLPQILVGRFFLGFGVAGIMTVTTTLIGDYYKGEQRQQLISYQGAFTGLGGMLFISLAGFLADSNWRLPFAIYSFSLVVLLFGVLYLKEPQKEAPSKNTEDIVEELNTAKKKTTYLIYFSAFVGIILFYILPLQIPFYVQSFDNVSNSMSGLAIGALTLTQAGFSLLYRKVKSKLSYQHVYALSFCIMACGYAVISWSTVYWQVIVGLVLSGIGTAWLMPNATLWLLSITPEKGRGKYIGQLTTFIFLGQFLSPVVVQLVETKFSLSTTFLILSAFLVVLSLSYFFKKRKL